MIFFCLCFCHIFALEVLQATCLIDSVDVSAAYDKVIDKEDRFGSAVCKDPIQIGKKK